SGRQLQRRHRRVERRRPVADRHAVRAADVVGERALERRDRLAEGAGDLAAPEGRDDGRDLVFAVDRLEYWNHALAPGLVGCPGSGILSFSAPRNGPCFTLTHCASSTTRSEWPPLMSSIASPGLSSTVFSSVPPSSKKSIATTPRWTTRNC